MQRTAVTSCYGQVFSQTQKPAFQKSGNLGRHRLGQLSLFQKASSSSHLMAQQSPRCELYKRRFHGFCEKQINFLVAMWCGAVRCGAVQAQSSAVVTIGSLVIGNIPRWFLVHLPRSAGGYSVVEKISRTAFHFMVTNTVYHTKTCK